MKFMLAKDAEEVGKPLDPVATGLCNPLIQVPRLFVGFVHCPLVVLVF